MIRFIDITMGYYALDDDDTLVDMLILPLCSFINTVTDKYIENDSGQHTFNDFDDIESIADANYRGRCKGLVPDGFFDLTSSYWKGKAHG